MTKALIIDTPWINYILEGKKDWEMRSRPTKIRGEIYLAKKGSGLLVARANLADSIGAFSLDEMLEYQHRHCIPSEMLPLVSKWCYAWVLENITPINPRKYKHPQGAVIWVNIFE